MYPIITCDSLTTHVQQAGHTFKLAVVCGSDNSTLQAVMRAVAQGYAEAFFVGDCHAIQSQPLLKAYNGNLVHYVEALTPEEAAQKAIKMAHNGQADVIVKGLIHTDTLLHVVLNKEWGILPKGNVLTHIAMCEMPNYHKLLFMSDAAVIPYPTDEQRTQQVAYLAKMLHAFGFAEPKVALIHCAETINAKFPHTLGYAAICQKAKSGIWGRLLVDGPLDLRSACDPQTLKIKGISSCLQGDADALVLPDIESANALYKALPLFAQARVAGTLQGTIVPVVLPSRGDDADAKYHSIALAIMGCQ